MICVGGGPSEERRGRQVRCVEVSVAAAAIIWIPWDHAQHRVNFAKSGCFSLEFSVWGLTLKL